VIENPQAGTWNLERYVDIQVSSGWVEVPQDVIRQFAETTGDRQWVHVDPDRARRDSPYGTTVAHGFLTLSLLSRLFRDAIRFEGGPRFAINYGLNKVRFPAPVPAGSRVRGQFTLLRFESVAANAIQATWSAVLECDGSAKPCCVAEWIVRYYS
jgi:acyl dehydratase